MLLLLLFAVVADSVTSAIVGGALLNSHYAHSVFLFGYACP